MSIDNELLVRLNPEHYKCVLLTYYAPVVCKYK